VTRNDYSGVGWRRDAQDAANPPLSGNRLSSSGWIEVWVAQGGFWGRGERRNRAYRIILAVWSVVLFGFALYAFFAYSAWDSSDWVG
jgi:hypothetical protein